MKLREIKAIAKGKAVKAGNMKKAELIKTIQTAEGFRLKVSISLIAFRLQPSVQGQATVSF